MKLLFKQRFFSWLDSYDIFNEAGETVYTVRGELDWGHCLKIYDVQDNELGTVKERILTWMPKFEIYSGEEYVGCVSKEFSFFSPKFSIDFNGWVVEGDCFEWDYTIVDCNGKNVAVITKELFNWTDTYSIDIRNPMMPFMF